MTTNEFLESIKETFNNCYNIAVMKNKDYANSDNPFKNFNMSEQVGVSPDRAILVRISDKLSRISNLMDREGSVINESVEDSIDDAINYLAILKAYKQYEVKMRQLSKENGKSTVKVKRI